MDVLDGKHPALCTAAWTKEQEGDAQQSPNVRLFAATEHTATWEYSHEGAKHLNKNMNFATSFKSTIINIFRGGNYLC